MGLSSTDDLARALAELPIGVELFAPDHRRVLANATAERLSLPIESEAPLTRALAGEVVELPPQWTEANDRARRGVRESWHPVPGLSGETRLAMRVLEETTTTELRTSRAPPVAPLTDEADIAVRQFRILADILPHFVWTARPDGTIDFISRSGYEYAGLTADEFLNWGWFAVLHPEDLQPTVQRLQESLITGHAFQVKNRFRRAADGMYRWHLSQCVPVRDASGTVVRWLGTATDIHDQQREAEMQALLASVSSALGASLDYESAVSEVGHLLLGGVADWCAVDLLERDGRLHRMCAASRDPADLTKLEAVKAYDNDAERVVARALHSGSFELRQQRASAAVPESVTEICVPLVAHGHKLGVLRLGAGEHRLMEPDRHLAQEIGRRIALAVDNARLYREANEASRLKDEFLATISHELRTPLNAILGWAQLLNAGRLGPQEMQRGLATIERNAKLQTSLIEDLLDIATIVVGKVRLELRPVHLYDVVNAAVESLRPSAEVRGLTVSIEGAPGAGAVNGDFARLQQVVWNLLANAIKFTPRGGRVTVALTAAGGETQVAVADTGQGIPPDFLPHVFERFRQGEGTESRRHGGLGLGLSIVRHLVELHGGRVWASSPGPGRGAVFTIALPTLGAAEEMLPQEERPERREPRLNGIRVLVVDDEPSAREVLRLMLGEAGADVLEAGSAREALELVRREPVSVVLSDIGMPDDDGYAFIHMLRKIPEHALTPAAALTAYARAQDAEKALDAGYQAHIAKPVERPRLLDTVRRLASAGGGTRP